MQELGILFFVS